jgi:hypothetical protein
VLLKRRGVSSVCNLTASRPWTKLSIVVAANLVDYGAHSSESPTMYKMHVLPLVLSCFCAIVESASGQTSQGSNDKYSGAMPEGAIARLGAVGLDKHLKAVRYLAFSADGKRLVSSDGGAAGSSAADVITWQTATWKFASRIHGADVKVNDYLLYAAADLTCYVAWQLGGTVSVRDLAGDKPLYVWPEKALDFNYPFGLFSADASFLLLGRLEQRYGD